MYAIRNYRQSTYLLVNIVLSVIIGTIAANKAQDLIERVDVAPPINWWGTMYLNRLLDQPATGDFLELDPSLSDPVVLNFGRGIAARAKTFLRNGRYRYDIFFVGFRAARGWPFVSRAPYVEVFVDEYDRAEKCISEHSFEADETGASPFRWPGCIGNTVAFSSFVFAILTLMTRVYCAIKRNRSDQKGGFPVIDPDTETKPTMVNRGH